VLTYFLIGALLGAITGVPIGPVNVAVIDASYRHSLRRALGVAVGGACGDGLFAYLGVVWFGPFINNHPIVPPILYALSGIALLSYGFVTVRAQELETSASGQSASANPGTLLGGFALGFILIVLNPSALITWVVVVGTYFSDISTLEGTTCAIGVACGSLGWFTMVAHLSHKGKNVLGHKMMWVTRTVGVLLILYGTYSMGRGAWLLYKVLS